ncbi:MAG: hypothetical protein K8R74_15480, partial [Bacteroidales bacterium]|nr:hypothetical protein [Bacteroidales bacterium]
DNGLVQIEGDGKFFLNQIPCRNTKFYFWHYVKPYIRFTKFGNEEDYVLHSDNTTVPDIFIKSKLGFGIDLNIVNWLLEYGEFNLDFGLRLDHSTLKTDPESSSKGTADLFTPYFKVGATVIESRNYGLECSFSHYWQNIMGNYGHGLDEDIKFPADSQTRYWVPEVLFYVGNKSALGTLFLKVIHYYAYQQPSGSFSQFHFGYNIRLKLPANRYGN